ncbi:hypothetical protein AALP_AA6G169400 [Arabis alpina]|uniref:Uncharacterized protein n=1 Tax=Arabis alpina TaxID=50452 RepID=A0A087GPR9_ARAAL|nr:hypothetical protein AALP_AA6G169400 [Arabis alpina]
MGNCSQRAVSDGGSITVIRTDSRNFMEEYYKNQSCSSLPITSEKALGYIVRQGTRSPRRDGPKIQMSPRRRNGVWKAKMVIGSKQLEEILAVEDNTHDLIDQLRFAAAEALASTSSSEMVRVRNLSFRSQKNNKNYFC